MISPASACTSTMRLVVMESERRKAVVMRMTEGSVENSTGARM